MSETDINSMENTCVMVVGSAKATNRRRPKILLAGFWLGALGFEADTLVSANYGNGSIVFEAQGKGMETYSRLIGQIRQNGAGLLQVRNLTHNKKRTPHLEIKGFWLEKFGFTIGDVIVVRYEYGRIKIKLLDRTMLDI